MGTFSRKDRKGRKAEKAKQETGDGRRETGTAKWITHHDLMSG